MEEPLAETGVSETCRDLPGPPPLTEASAEVHVQEDVMALEEELVEVLRTLSPPKEKDVPGRVHGHGLKAVTSARQEHSGDNEPSSVREMSPCLVEHRMVDVEVHCEASFDNDMEEEINTRKRAVASDSDVLMPAHRPERQEGNCNGGHDKRHRKKGGGR